MEAIHAEIEERQEVITTYCPACAQVLGQESRFVSFCGWLIAAGLSLDEVNHKLWSTPADEIRDMNTEARMMKECPNCGREISLDYLRNAYFYFLVFHCQCCNSKLRVLVDGWHFGHVVDLNV